MIDVTKVIAELVSYNTTNPPGENYDAISYYLRDLLKEIGFSVEMIEVPEEFLDKQYIYSPRHKGKRRYIIYAKNDREPIVHFNAHYDVVPPGTGWESDPFRLKVVGDVAYGRGVSDMKGGIVSMLMSLTSSNVPAEISLVPDEESGGIGSLFLSQLGKVNSKYTIIGEPSFPDIYIGHNGIIRGVVKVKGKQAHGSKVYEGKNAFVLASKLALEIDKAYGEDLRGKGIALNLGGYTINSSDNDGIIPGEFSFSFYRSILPEEKEVDKEVLSKINEVAEKLGIEYEVIVKSYVNGYKVDPNSFIVKTAEECVIKLMNLTPRKVISDIRFDGVFFGKVSEVINIGPGNDAHNPNESIRIKNIYKVSEVYKCLMNSLKP